MYKVLSGLHRYVNNKLMQFARDIVTNWLFFHI